MTSRGTPPWVTVRVLSITISKAEPGVALSERGRPLGLPLWPLRNLTARRLLRRRFAHATLRFDPARFLAGHRCPAVNGDIDIGRIDIEAAEPTAAAFRRDQRGARAEKDVENQLASPGHVLNGVGDQRRRLHRGVQRQVLAPAAGHGVHRRIVPDVGSVAPVAAKLDGVEVRRFADPVDEDELVLGAVERTHAGVRLVPDAEVELVAVNQPTHGRDVVEVPPVDADEVHGAIARNCGAGAERIGEEATERRFVHLARGHRELAVPPLALA